MDLKKAGVLTIFVFLIVGIVYYQMNATRGRSGGQALPPVVVAPGVVAGAAATAPVVPAPSGLAGQEKQIAQAVLSGSDAAQLLPAHGWGRNPFLSVEEIERLHAPVIAQAETPVAAPPPPVVEPLPQHVFSGVLISNNDAVVYLNGKLMRVGAQIGKETVKEIHENSVVLESDGKTRVLSRKTNPSGEKTRPKGD